MGAYDGTVASLLVGFVLVWPGVIAKAVWLKRNREEEVDKLNTREANVSKQATAC